MIQATLALSRYNTHLADILQMRLPEVHWNLHFAEENTHPGAFSAAFSATEGPVLLLITDNFMKSEYCMAGILEAVLGLMRQNRLMVVVANGTKVENGETVAVETHIDRVVYAIQYMNYWQQEYLALSDRYNHADDQSRAELFRHQQLVHDIADQTGELISALRDADALKWEALSAADFQEIKKYLGVAVSPQMADPVVPDVPEAAPEPTSVIPPTVTPPAGPVWFRPAEPVMPAPEQPIDMLQDFDAQLHLIHSDQPETSDDINGHYRDSEIDETIKDAWAWIARGNRELGLEVFRVALEQYPQHETLRNEYEKALTEAPEMEEVMNNEQEAHAYEVAGDSAFNDGDYLMAKYCWDRSAETHPGMPGIWRKLGLLTSEQLTGYTETSIIYLKKALEQKSDDQEVIDRLSQLGVVVTPPVAPVEIPAEPEIVVPEPMPEDASPVALNIEPEILPEPETISAATVVVEQPVAAVPVPARRDEIVLITGATSGIGKATAIEFARHGYRIIITGRRAERLLDMRNYLESAFGVEVLPLVFDVRDQKAVESTLTLLPESWQNIDILINNAGLAKGLAPIHEGALEHWETMIDTNIKGLLYVTQIVSRTMVRRRKGHIVNISSSAGKEAYPNGNVYCATKFAVEALTKSLRFDLHKYNIRVSQVSPGHVEETEFALTRFDGDAQKARIYDDFQPLRASDVAEAIWFIASRPAHVNIQDVYMFGTQQASATVVDRSGR